MPEARAIPTRHRLPEERQAITHKFDIGGHEGYITVGLYEDGSPGELFMVLTKEGTTISGFADAFAMAITMLLQYGVPLSVITEKFSHLRFEPSGMSRNPQIRFAKSIVDYVMRWMSSKFPLPASEMNSRVESEERRTCRSCGETFHNTYVVCPCCGAGMN